MTIYNIVLTICWKYARYAAFIQNSWKGLAIVNKKKKNHWGFIKSLISGFVLKKERDGGGGGGGAEKNNDQIMIKELGLQETRWYNLSHLSGEHDKKRIQKI